MILGPVVVDEILVERIADNLRGTCKTLAQALNDLELPECLESDIQFCETLDNHVFCCETCDWWCELSEMADTAEGQHCDECVTGDDDDE